MAKCASCGVAEAAKEDDKCPGCTGQAGGGEGQQDGGQGQQGGNQPQK